jgi:hypothetical protein
MKRKGAAPGFSSPWWNDECRDAARNLRSAETDEERKACDKKLKQVTRYAKRDWANKFINESNIWEVAAWRHGRRSSHIPALIDHSGALTYDHQGMADLLSERFFTDAREDIPTSFPDDPPKAPTRDFPAFAKKNLRPPETNGEQIGTRIIRNWLGTPQARLAAHGQSTHGDLYSLHHPALSPHTLERSCSSGHP